MAKLASIYIYYALYLFLAIHFIEDEENFHRHYWLNI
jgi:hypothetical protein